MQAEIRQLVSLVRNGKKTNLVRLKEALSPTKEPPRSPTSAGHGRATKNIFASQNSTDGGNRVLRFDAVGNEDATVDEGADTDVLVASSTNERLARKAATLMNDVDEGTKDQSQEGDSNNQSNVATAAGSLTDEEVRTINDNEPSVTGEDKIKNVEAGAMIYPMRRPHRRFCWRRNKQQHRRLQEQSYLSMFYQSSTFQMRGAGRGKPIPKDRYELMKDRIKEVFKDKPQGIKPDEFVALTKEFCGLPSFLSTPLHCRVRWYYQRTLPNQEKISEQDALAISATKKKEETDTPKDSNRNVVDTENALVTLEMFEVYWRNEIEPYDVTDRFSFVEKD